MQPDTATSSQAYDSCIAEAASGGRQLMEKMLAHARQAMMQRVVATADASEQSSLRESVRQLDACAPRLVDAYPQELFKAFTGGVQDDSRPAPVFSFDELELMDESQVQENVELARAQQAAALAAEAPLAQFNALICAAQGLRSVQPGRNPLRPNVYVRALRTVLSQCGASSSARLRWMPFFGEALGEELGMTYVGLSMKLKAAGITAAGYAVTQVAGPGVRPAAAQPVAAGSAAGQEGAAPAASVPGAAGGVPAGGPSGASASASAARASGATAPAAVHPEGGRTREEVILTVAQLRRLLAGELDATGDAGNAGKGESRTARRSDFGHTMPAAFEALQEMRQVDEVMKRLQGRVAAGAPPTNNAGGSARQVPPEIPPPQSAGTLAGLREQLRADARGVGQSLGLEVVNLMVDNIARDARLLEPVQQAVRQMEPALLRLALIDPRFFSDKMHPARRMLEQMTQRSLAWKDERDPSFRAFMEPLSQVVRALGIVPIENAEPFEFALKSLQEAWAELSRRERQRREAAVQSLMQAEQRNLLADKLARDIRAREGLAQVTPELATFLVGPWAQVMAQARLADAGGQADPGGFGAVIDDLLWSARPELARNALPRLTRLIPTLLAKLREGLASIDYPSADSAAFFDRLMDLHQQALRPALSPPLVPLAPLTRAELEARFASERDGAEPWIAPAEARHSGFMDTRGWAEPAGDGQTPDGDGDNAGEHPGFDATQPGFAATQPHSGWRQRAHPQIDQVDELIPSGAWVEFIVKGRTRRTQLTWSSPHGTLFMFTDAEGGTHSMTRRSVQRLLDEGSLRIVSDHAVVDEALDAVAQTALRNSLDIAF